jgi:AcrR family transcriptional regulator
MSVEAVRQRDAPRTKAKILAAAQQAFAEIGYARAGIREIAAIADVSSTLLLRYYGSKAGLFEAALIDAVTPDVVFAAPRARFGAYVAAALSRSELDIKPPPMIAMAVADEEAREIATRVALQYSVTPLAKWLGGADAKGRAARIMTLAVGFVMFTRQIPLTGARIDKKHTQWLAESLQAIVDES